jgi:hypothetical protein
MAVSIYPSTFFIASEGLRVALGDGVSMAVRHAHPRETHHVPAHSA